MSPNDAFAQSVGAAMSYLNSIGLDFEIIDDEADEWLIWGIWKPTLVYSRFQH